MRHSSVIIFILALAATLSITWGVFEAMPHIEDEFANYFQAQVFASGQLWAASPPHPDSFFIPFVIDLNGRRFAKYPPGFAAALALGVRAGVHWLVNPLIGALTLVVLYAIGRNLFDAETGLLAAMLGMLSPMFLGLSSTLLAHPLTALCLLIFTWAYFTCLSPAARRLPPAIAGGLALGWAALTRPYTALAYALPFAVMTICQLGQTRHRSQFAAFALMGLTAVAIAALLPLYGHALTGRYTVDLYTLFWPYDRLGFGLGHGHAPEGHTLTKALNHAAVDLGDLLTKLLGWPYLSWLPVLLGLGLPPRRRDEWKLVLPFGAIGIAQLAYWVPGSGLYGPRYYYEAVPLLWLLAARGLSKLWQALANRARLQKAMALALAGLIAINTFGVLPPLFQFWHGLYGITAAPRQQIARSNIHNALIFVRITQHWGDYNELAWTNTVSLDGDIVFASDEGTDANAAVMAAYPHRRVLYWDGTTFIEPHTLQKLPSR